MLNATELPVNELQPFPNNSNFSDSNQDPDVNFFLDNILSLNTE